MNEYIKNKTLLSALITSLENNISLSKQEEKDIRRYLEDYQKALNEIERLNNIINELEKELDRGYRDLFDYELVNGRELINNIKNYLQELKESDK